MLTIRKKLAEQASKETKQPSAEGVRVQRRLSFRSQLLTAEASELGEVTPGTCSVAFDDPNDLRTFTLTVKPDEGFWKNGTFIFYISVPVEYNIKPPCVRCDTRLWHPNITETGEVCLSILRETSIDGTGWSPARRLKDVVLGINSLFTDLLNFDDPLNPDAASHYQRDKGAFARKVQQFIRLYAS